MCTLLRYCKLASLDEIENICKLDLCIGGLLTSQWPASLTLALVTDRGKEVAKSSPTNSLLHLPSYIDATVPHIFQYFTGTMKCASSRAQLRSYSCIQQLELRQKELTVQTLPAAHAANDWM